MSRVANEETEAWGPLFPRAPREAGSPHLRDRWTRERKSTLPPLLSMPVSFTWRQPRVCRDGKNYDHTGSSRVLTAFRN